MQLVLKSPETLYLNENPQITNFKIVYRRHSNFSIFENDIKIKTNPSFGDNFEIKIKNIGDLLYGLNLIIDFPKINLLFGNPNVKTIKKLLESYGVTWNTSLDDNYNLSIQEYISDVNNTLITNLLTSYISFYNKYNNFHKSLIQNYDIMKDIFLNSYYVTKKTNITPRDYILINNSNITVDESTNIYYFYQISNDENITSTSKIIVNTENFYKLNSTNVLCNEAYLKSLEHSDSNTFIALKKSYIDSQITNLNSTIIDVFLSTSNTLSIYFDVSDTNSNFIIKKFNVSNITSTTNYFCEFELSNIYLSDTTTTNYDLFSDPDDPDNYVENSNTSSETLYSYLKIENIKRDSDTNAINTSIIFDVNNIKNEQQYFFISVNDIDITTNYVLKDISAINFLKNDSNSILYSYRTYLDTFSASTTGDYYALKKELILDSSGNLKTTGSIFMNKNQYKSNIYYNHGTFQKFTLLNTDSNLSTNLSDIRHLIKNSDINNLLTISLSEDKLEKFTDTNGNQINITLNLDTNNYDTSSSNLNYYYLDSAAILDGSNYIFNNSKIPRTLYPYSLSSFVSPNISTLNDVVVKLYNNVPSKIKIYNTTKNDITFFMSSILGDLIPSSNTTKKIIYDALLALGTDVLNSNINNRNIQISTFKDIRKDIYDEFLQRIFKEARTYDSLKFSFSKGDGSDEYFLINLSNSSETIDIDNVDTFSFTFTDSTINRDTIDNQIKFYSKKSLLSETHSSNNSYIAVKKSTIYTLRNETELIPAHYLFNQTEQVTLTKTNDVFLDIIANSDGTYKKFSINSTTLNDEFSSYSYHNALIYHLIDMGTYSGLPEKSKILNNYFKYIFDEYYTNDGVNNENEYNERSDSAGIGLDSYLCYKNYIDLNEKSLVTSIARYGYFTSSILEKIKESIILHIKNNYQVNLRVFTSIINLISRINHEESTSPIRAAFTFKSSSVTDVTTTRYIYGSAEALTDTKQQTNIIEDISSVTNVGGNIKIFIKDSIDSSFSKFLEQLSNNTSLTNVKDFTQFPLVFNELFTADNFRNLENTSMKYVLNDVPESITSTTTVLSQYRLVFDTNKKAFLNQIPYALVLNIPYTINQIILDGEFFKIDSANNPFSHVSDSISRNLLTTTLRDMLNFDLKDLSLDTEGNTLFTYNSVYSIVYTDDSGSSSTYSINKTEILQFLEDEMFKATIGSNKSSTDSFYNANYIKSLVSIDDLNTDIYLISPFTIEKLLTLNHNQNTGYFNYKSPIEDRTVNSHDDYQDYYNFIGRNATDDNQNQILETYTNLTACDYIVEVYKRIYFRVICDFIDMINNQANNTTINKNVFYGDSTITTKVKFADYFLNLYSKIEEVLNTFQQPLNTFPTLLEYNVTYSIFKDLSVFTNATQFVDHKYKFLDVASSVWNVIQKSNIRAFNNFFYKDINNGLFSNNVIENFGGSIYKKLYDYFIQLIINQLGSTYKKYIRFNNYVSSIGYEYDFSTYNSDLATQLDPFGEEGIDFYRLRYVTSLYDNLRKISTNEDNYYNFLIETRYKTYFYLLRVKSLESNQKLYYYNTTFEIVKNLLTQLSNSQKDENISNSNSRIGNDNVLTTMIGLGDGTIEGMSSSGVAKNVISKNISIFDIIKSGTPFRGYYLKENLTSSGVNYDYTAGVSNYGYINNSDSTYATALLNNLDNIYQKILILNIDTSSLTSTTYTDSINPYSQTTESNLYNYFINNLVISYDSSSSTYSTNFSTIFTEFDTILNKITPQILYENKDKFNNYKFYSDAINFTLNHVLFDNESDDIQLLKDISEKTFNLTSLDAFNYLKGNIEQKILEYGNKIFNISVWESDKTNIFKYDSITNNYQYKPISSISDLNITSTNLYIKVNKILTGILPSYQWSRAVGIRILENISLYIDDQLIDSHNDELLSFIYNNSISTNKKVSIKNLIGDIEELYTYKNTVRDGFRVRIPLKFWFCNHEGNSLPLISLIHSNVKIRIKFRELNEILKIEDDGIIQNNLKLKTKLSCDLIYLDDDERKLISKAKHEYLIERFQHSNNNIFGKNNLIDDNQIILKLYFNDPTKYIYWKVKFISSSFSDFDWLLNDYYTKDSNDNITYTKSIDFIKIKFMGRNREGFKDYEYYNVYHPYCRGIYNLGKGEFLYSFCLNSNPRSIQPSGSANLTNIDDISLIFQLNDNIITKMNNENLQISIKAWSCSYNILAINSGLAGLRFFGN